MFYTIKNKLLAVLLALSAASCAPMGHVDPRPFKTISGQFEDYVDEFEADYNYKVTVPMGFVEEFENTERVGVCYFKTVSVFNGSITYKWVSFKRSYWDNATDKQRLSLVYHELIHCEFEYMKHTNEVRSDGCPQSIMHESQASGKCLNKHWDSYVSEWQ